jgi:putative methyltransferase (TIGR04325 family)
MKDWIPPILYHQLRKLKPRDYGWMGDYATWSEAVAATDGYDSEVILKEVEEAVRKVKDGEAVFERDSVLFDHPEYNWPLLAALMYVAANHGGKLDIIDFGGSLGSTYFQNRPFFKKLNPVLWNVIEQPHFAETGKNKFSSEHLKFYGSIEECMAVQKTDTLLLSGVLHYIEKPFELLDELLSSDFKTIIIDRTPFSYDNRNRICIQKVPPSIYDASYPSHVFSYDVFTAYFLKHKYKLHSRFDALDGETPTCYFKGFIFEQ